MSEPKASDPPAAATSVAGQPSFAAIERRAGVVVPRRELA